MPGDNLPLTLTIKARDEASAQIKGVQGTLGQLRGHINAVNAAAGAMGLALVAAVGGAVKKTADYGEEMLRLSKVSGMRTEDISKLAYAAKQSETDIGGVARGMRFFAKYMQETGQSGRSMNDVLYEMADKFKSMPDGADKLALAVKVFGRSGAAMIPLLNEGSAGLKKMGEEAVKLGVVISREDAQAADDFNDALESLKAGLGGLAMSLGKELLPPLIRIAELFKGLIEWLNGLPGPLKTAIYWIGGIAIAFGLVNYVLGASGLKAAIVWLIGTGLPALAAWWGTVTGAATAAAVAQGGAVAAAGAGWTTTVTGAAAGAGGAGLGAAAAGGAGAVATGGILALIAAGVGVAGIAGYHNIRNQMDIVSEWAQRRQTERIVGGRLAYLQSLTPEQRRLVIHVVPDRDRIFHAVKVEQRWDNYRR